MVSGAAPTEDNRYRRARTAGNCQARGRVRDPSQRRDRRQHPRLDDAPPVQEVKAGHQILESLDLIDVAARAA